jgi:prolyl-tRNA synthetase
MRWTNFLIPTARTNLSNVCKSHELLIKGGFITQASSGLYYYLPLGLKVIRKIEKLIRTSLNDAGCLEVSAPVMQHSDLWKKSGRYEAYGNEKFEGKDRNGDFLIFSPTAEESMTDLILKNINSYKQLPIVIYQNNVKFRDEIRPQGGIMRSREFLMSDTYSFAETLEDSMDIYVKIFNAYVNIFSGLNLKYVYARGDAGAIGGSLNHEFLLVTPSGDSKIYIKKSINEQNHFCHKKTVEEINYSGGIVSDIFKENSEDFYVETGIEVGHMFYFDTKYSKPMDLTVINKNDKKTEVLMGSYGIGISRLAAALIEVSHDEFGIIWPSLISPFLYHLINLSDDVRAEKIYYGIIDYEVLFDDRDYQKVSAGVKLKDADLIGIPYHIIVGKEIEILERKRNSVDGARISIKFNCVEDVIEFIHKQNLCSVNKKPPLFC